MAPRWFKNVKFGRDLTNTATNNDNILENFKSAFAKQLDGLSFDSTGPIIEEVLSEHEIDDAELDCIEIPVQSSPVRALSVQETSGRLTSLRAIRETPVRETSVRETPVRATPVRETSVRKTPLRASSRRETSVRTTPFQASSIQVSPVRVSASSLAAASLPTRSLVATSLSIASSRASSISSLSPSKASISSLSSPAAASGISSPKDACSIASSVAAVSLIASPSLPSSPPPPLSPSPPPPADSIAASPAATTTLAKSLVAGPLEVRSPQVTNPRGVRRSNRQRWAPLDYARGERPIYKRNGATFELAGFDQGFPAQYNYKKKTKITKPKKRTTTLPAGCISAEPIDFRPAKRGEYHLQIKQINNLITGSIRLAPGKMKPEAKTSLTNSYMFLVRTGQVIFKITLDKQTESIHASTDSNWVCIDNGKYSIKNCGTDIAEVAYIVLDKTD